MAFSIPDSISKVIPGSLGSLGSITKHVPTEWGLIAAVIFLLPLIGMFFVPSLRLGGAVFQGIAAIGTAIVVCLTSWSVLAIGYLTAMSRAFHPRGNIDPYFRWIFVGMVAAGAYYFCPRVALPASLLSVIAVTVTLFGTYRVAMLLARRLVIPAGWVPRICVGLVCAGVLFILLQIGGASRLNRPAESNLNSCLKGGKIDFLCVRVNRAEQF